MKVSVQKKNDVNVLYPEGEFTYEESDDIRQMILDLIDKSEVKILINLKRVDYIDSSGIGIFIRFFGSLRTSGGELILCEPKESVANIIKLAKVQKFIQLFMHEDEALAAMSDIKSKKEETAPEETKIPCNQLDMYIIEIMSLLLESEATSILKTNEIIELLQKVKHEYDELETQLK